MNISTKQRAFINRQRKLMYPTGFTIMSPMQFFEAIVAYHQHHIQVVRQLLKDSSWKEVMKTVLAGVAVVLLLISQLSLSGAWSFFCVYYVFMPFLSEFWQNTQQDITIKKACQQNEQLDSVLYRSLAFWNNHPFILGLSYDYCLNQFGQHPIKTALTALAEQDLQKVEYITAFLDSPQVPQAHKDELRQLANELQADFLKPFAERSFLHQPKVYEACLDKIRAFKSPASAQQ